MFILIIIFSIIKKKKKRQHGTATVLFLEGFLFVCLSFYKRCKITVIHMPFYTSWNPQGLYVYVCLHVFACVTGLDLLDYCDLYNYKALPYPHFDPFTASPTADTYGNDPDCSSNTWRKANMEERNWLLETVRERSGSITSYTAKQVACDVRAVARSD